MGVRRNKEEEKEDVSNLDFGPQKTAFAASMWWWWADAAIAFTWKKKEEDVAIARSEKIIRGSHHTSPTPPPLFSLLPRPSAITQKRKRRER